jgi:hypothetical protein
LVESRTTKTIYVLTTITKVITESTPTTYTERALFNVSPFVSPNSRLFFATFISCLTLLALLALLAKFFVLLYTGLYAGIAVSNLHSTYVEVEPLRDGVPPNSHPLHSTTQNPEYEGNDEQLVEAVHRLYDLEHINSRLPSGITPSMDSGKAAFVDNGRIECFTWHSATTKPKFSDWLKRVVEACLQHPVIWWPLKPRRVECTEHDLRVSWYCVSDDRERSHKFERHEDTSSKPMMMSGHFCGKLT